MRVALLAVASILSVPSSLCAQPADAASCAQAALTSGDAASREFEWFGRSDPVVGQPNEALIEIDNAFRQAHRVAQQYGRVNQCGDMPLLVVSLIRAAQVYERLGEIVQRFAERFPEISAVRVAQAQCLAMQRYLLALRASREAGISRESEVLALERLRSYGSGRLTQCVDDARRAGVEMSRATDWDLRPLP